jgi:hypothetical protein
MVPPLLIDQLYALIAAGPEYELPVELAQTWPAPAIEQAGSGLIVTVCELLEPHEETVTVTLSVKDEPVPAVYVTVELVPPAVIVPPEIVQAYVAPVCVGTEAVLPVELAHTAEAAVIVELGSGTVTVFDPLLEQPAELRTVMLRTTLGPVPAV